MKEEAMMKTLAEEFVEVMDQNQITVYQLLNKPYLPDETRKILEIESKVQENKMELLKEEIIKENRRLKNQDIENIYEFVNGYR